MSGFVLKVSVDTLKSKASEIQTQVNNVEKNWEKMSQIIQNSKSYWEGEASDEHQKYRTDIEDDVQVMIKRLKEHPTNLLEMAGVYEETEQEIVQLTSALPDDIIS
jgi:WXG100 family type VII secretion target